MLGSGFFVIFIVLIVIGLPVLCVTFLIAFFSSRRGKGEKDKTQWNEDTCIMQEVHDDLARMETRIEALETILMERFGKENK